MSKPALRPSVLVLTHEDCAKHNPGRDHPESPQRLQAVLEAVKKCKAACPSMMVEKAPSVTWKALSLVHPIDYIRSIESMEPKQGIAWLDEDTAMGPHSLAAMRRAAGAVQEATAKVLAGEYQRAFCAVRPPGHHAEPSKAMGFCFFNNIAIGVTSALAAGARRIAIVDFDVHHGNGTQAVLAGDDRVLFCSLFQYPLYPNPDLEPPNNAVFVPLAPGTDGPAYRESFSQLVLPRLLEFSPELVFISAGFDAHSDDPLAELLLVPKDFSWLTAQLVEVANESAHGRIVSSLEGGYNLAGLGLSVEAHLSALCEP